MSIPSAGRAHFISILDARRDVPTLKRLLAGALSLGLWRDPFVAARLIAALASSDDLALAQLALDACHRPTAFAYTALVRAHSAGPFPALALIAFRRMLRAGLYPDRFALPFLLRACARVADPSPAHAVALARGLDRDPHVGTSLLHAYASRGGFTCARKVFDEMPERTTVTWNAMLSCCARSASHDEGLDLFAEMLHQGARANSDTLVAALSCCAGLGALARGRSLHAVASRSGTSGTQEVGASLLHMYARCGVLEYATRVFERMNVRDLPTWTAMIGGLGMHGRGLEALSLFDRMVEKGIKPDCPAFTSILHACSHSGLVHVGIRVFNEMKEVYRVETRIEHYGAMVDLLARAGRFDDVKQMINSMPSEPSPVVWGSLLNACVVNGESEFGVRLENGLIELGLESSEQSGFLVGVSNVYAGCGRWDEVGRVREAMVERGVKKEKGFSLVEVDGRVHKFLVGDTRHALITKEMHRLLDCNFLII